MEMFLSVVCISVFGMAIAALAFGAATRSESSAPAVQPPAPAQAIPARFFADSVAPIVPAPTPQVPIELLLQQIESHVRLEQADAESFVNFPTHAVLHSKTSSPFVN